MSLLRSLLLSALVASPLAAQQAALSVGELLKRPADAARTLTNGESRSGALGPTSLMLDDSSRVELWYFSGTAGQRVTVRQRAADFDTFLHVGRQGADEPLVQNDDAGDDGVNSAAELTLPADGIYVIVANAYEPSGRGSYTVSLEIREPAPGMTGPVTPARVMLREVEPLQRLGLGQRFGSQLDTADARMDDGTHFELWYVHATAGDTLHLAVESTDFPPALYVGKQGGESVLVEATDARRASVRFNVTQSGTYVIAVRATRPAAVGNYFLDLSRAGPPR